MIAIRSLCAVSLILILAALGESAFLVRAQGPPAQNPPTAAQGSPVDKLTPDDIAMGKQLFAANCASCHGVDGSGQLGPNLHGVVQRRGERECSESCETEWAECRRCRRSTISECGR